MYETVLLAREAGQTFNVLPWLVLLNISSHLLQTPVTQRANGIFYAFVINPQSHIPELTRISSDDTWCVHSVCDT